MENHVLDNDLQKTNEEPEVEWAGFWVRVGASLIDFFVYLPFAGLSFYNLNNSKNLYLQLFCLLVMMLYKPLMEFRYGATLGKMAVGIKVVSNDFQSITLPQSTLRYLPWLVGQVISLFTAILLFQHPDFEYTSGMTELGYLQNEIISPLIRMLSSVFLLVSCLVVAFSENKQGLHDMIGSTYCIFKKS